MASEDRGRQVMRQWKLLLFLQHSRRPRTLWEIGQHLEDEGHKCSEKTLERDLDQLVEAGFDLAAEDRGWVLGEAPGLARRVDPTECIAFLVAEAHRPPSFMDGSLRAMAENFRASLSNEQLALVDVLRQRMVHSTPGRVDDPDEQRHLGMLQEAVRGQLVTRIKYHSMASGGMSWRIVRPYAVVHRGGGIYLVADDDRRAAMLTFALQRIHGIAITDDAFERDSSFEVEEFINKSFGMIHEPERRIEVEFSGELMYLVTERIFHPSQRVIDTDWGCLVTWHMSGLIEVARWVAGFGGHARVHAPRELKDLVRNLHEEGLESELD